MFKHLLKLIWNRKGKNALLIVEIFLSFIVFFAVLSFGIYNFNNYRKPLGFDYENVWVLNINWGQKAKSEAWQKTKQMQEQLAQYSQIQSVALTETSLPFSFSNSNNDVTNGEIHANAEYYNTDANYAEVLGMELIEGRFYTNEDTISGNIPAMVISKLTKEALFEEGENAVGKIVTTWRGEHRVVGVVEQFRRENEFARNHSKMFLQFSSEKDYAPAAFLIKVEKGTDVVFEEKMMRSLAQIAPDITFELEYMDNKRIVANRLITIPLIIMSVICIFLLINVALGLFGVLWYNINQRKGEIGLRQALGSTSARISQQFVSEMWILASFGVIIGMFFAIQFPILNVFDVSTEIYLLAILCSFLLVFLLTTLCAVLPSSQAANILPAVALREE